MEKLKNQKAEITNEKIQKEFIYKDTVILTVDITYPQVKLDNSPKIENKINRTYEKQATSFFRYASTRLYKSAIKDYNYSVENGFPIRPYDAVMVYTITLNGNCHLSTYYDRYEFTGGAHGITYRASDNWSLQTGQYIMLKDLFPNSKNYKAIILEQIIKMADKDFIKNPGMFFENYKELIVKSFNEESFNLKPHTLSIYFQQYDIGPYVSGFITFDIPYKTLGIEAPKCMI